MRNFIRRVNAIVDQCITHTVHLITQRAEPLEEFHDVMSGNKRPRKTDAELRRLAIGIVGGSVFTDRHLHVMEAKHMIQLVFLPLNELSDEMRQQMLDDEVAMIYEYVDKSIMRRNPNHFDKLPCFFSFQYLSADEVDRIQPMIDELYAFEDAT